MPRTVRTREPGDDGSGATERKPLASDGRIVCTRAGKKGSPFVYMLAPVDGESSSRQPGAKDAAI